MQKFITRYTNLDENKLAEAYSQIIRTKGKVTSRDEENLEK